MEKTNNPDNSMPQRRHDVDMIVVLCALSLMPIFLYGLPALWLILTAVVTAVVTEYICLRIRGIRRFEKGDFSYLITALIVALLLPASAPLWAAAVAVAFGLCIAKHPFGGRGANIFNPAAAGIAFVTICWPEVLTQYPAPFSEAGGVFSFSTSPASTLRVGGTPRIELFDVLLGKFAGPMGATFMIVLAVCLLFLLFRKTASFRVIAPAVFVVGIFAVFFPRLTTGRFNSLEFEFASGALVFGLTFMVSDPATLPDTKGGQLVYGFLIGIFTVILRRVGPYDVEIVYALLLANALSSSCDSYAASLFRLYGRAKKLLRERMAAKQGKAGDADA